MFPALFPVRRDASSDVLPGVEMPGAVQSGADSEKKEQFARLLFVSLEGESAGGEEIRAAVERPLFACGTRPLTTLAASLFENDGKSDIACTVNEDILSPDALLTSILASTFAEVSGMQVLPVSDGISENSSCKIAGVEGVSYLAGTGDLELFPESSLTEKTLLESPQLLLSGENSAEENAGGTHSTKSASSLFTETEGAFALPDSFEQTSASDPKIEEMLSRLSAPNEQRTALSAENISSESGRVRANPAAAPLSTNAVGAAWMSITEESGAPGKNVPQSDAPLRTTATAVAYDGQTSATTDVVSAQIPRRVSFDAVESLRTEESLDATVIPASVAERSRAATPFSMSMTDNVRPRRNFSLAGQGGISADTVSESDADVSLSSRGERRTLRPLLSGASSRAGEASVAERVVSDMSSASVTERSLKTAAEAELSTTRLTEGRAQEQNIFPAARNLFGETESGTNASQAGDARTGRSRPFSILKENTKGDDFGPNTGKESAESALFSAAARPLQTSSQSNVSFANLLSGETRLQGRNGVALEDGVQHVVRFLRTEGRQAASIIVDPPALGRMEIELVTTAKGVEASIKVSSEQVRQLVQDHIVVLRNNLEQQGVHLGAFVVDLRDNTKGNSGRNAFAGEGNSKRRSIAAANSDIETEHALPSFRVDLEHGLLSWVA